MDTNGFFTKGPEKYKTCIDPPYLTSPPPSTCIRNLIKPTLLSKDNFDNENTNEVKFGSALMEATMTKPMGDTMNTCRTLTSTDRQK